MDKTSFLKVFAALSLFGVFISNAPASMIQFEKLNRIVARSDFLTQGKIIATDKKTFRDSIEYYFTIKSTQPVFGNVTADKIQAKYVLILPREHTFIGDLGKLQRLWVTPLETGSGLEDKARAGQEYIFLFETSNPEENYFRLLRIESIDKMDEVKRLLELPETVAFCAKVNSITTIDGISTQKRALATDIDPRWILNVRIQWVADDQEMLSEDTTVDFAIHSPTKMFLENPEKVIGTQRAFELKRTRTLPATTSYDLKAFPWLIENEEVRIYDVQIIDWGMYKPEIAQKKNTDTIASGIAFILNGKELIKQTDQIAAKKGLSFGFRYWLKGFPGTATPLVKIIVQHPPIRNPETGKEQTESFWEDNAYIGALNYHTGWLFAYDYEIVPGKWAIKLYYQDKELLEKQFLVRAE